MSVTSDQDIDWKITQGESFDLQIQYVDPDENPIDITGFDIKMEVKDKPGGRVKAVTLTIGQGISLTDIVNGIFDIKITPSQTIKFMVPKAFYEIWGTDQYSETILFLQGWFEVRAE